MSRFAGVGVEPCPSTQRILCGVADRDTRKQARDELSLPGR
jgi:hypothetical protein